MKKTNVGKENKTEAGKDNLKEREFVFYVIIISFLILLLPHLLRFFSGNMALMGGQAYYHAGAAENLLANNFNAEGNADDMKVYGGRRFVSLPYHFMLAVFGSLFGMETASRLLPFLLGLFSVMIFYNLMKNFGLGLFERFIVSLLLIISPPFIYLFTISNPNAFSVFITLLGSLLFLRQNKIAYIASLACFIIASLSGVFNALIIIGILFFFTTYDEKNKAKAFIAAITLFLVYFIHPAGFYYNFEYSPVNILASFFTDLGAQVGFSVFSIILALIGLFSSWNRKSRLYPLYLTLIFLIISTLYVGQEANLYANFIIILLASFGLYELKTMVWKFATIKNLSFIVIGCGLLFSMLSYMNSMPKMLPDNGIIDSLKWLRENSDEHSIVLSHPSKGYWVEAVAKRPVLMDGFSDSIMDYSKKHLDMNDIFYSVDLDDTAELIRKYNISYIFIDNEMRQGLVWSREKEGLLYLLRNNRTFEMVHSQDDAELWKAKVY